MSPGGSHTGPDLEPVLPGLCASGTGCPGPSEAPEGPASLLLPRPHTGACPQPRQAQAPLPLLPSLIPRPLTSHSTMRNPFVWVNKHPVKIHTCFFLLLFLNRRVYIRRHVLASWRLRGWELWDEDKEVSLGG